MIEGVILAIVIVIAFGIIALPFIWNFLVDKNSFSNINLSKAALYISFVVIVSIILATAFKINSAIDINKGADFIVKAIVPLATIAGFYMVYQTFIVQSENSLKEEVHNLIKLQDRILSEIVLVEKTTSKPGKESTLEFCGRVAFKKIIDDFNKSYLGYQKIWNVFILKSIEAHAIPEVKIKAKKYLSEIIDNGSYTENPILKFIKDNFYFFKEKVVLDEFLKTLSYEEMLASTLYIRIYFDEETGDEYFKSKFDFKSNFSMFPFFMFHPFSSGINYNFKFTKVPWSGFSKFSTVNYINSLDFKVLLEKASRLSKSSQFYPEDLINKSRENSQDLHLYLDTYFRSLFNAYKTISKFENKKLKEDSARLLRTQISSYEQAVIFLNSLTPMGAMWQKKGDLDLFKELNTIKNIPENVLTHIQPWDVYPIEKGFK